MKLNKVDKYRLKNIYYHDTRIYTNIEPISIYMIHLNCDISQIYNEITTLVHCK